MHHDIEEALELIEKIWRKFEELRTKINNLLSAVPAWLEWAVEQIHNAWDGLVQKANEFAEEVERIVGYVGDPGGLARAADSWNLDVGEPVMAQSREVELGNLLVDDNWTGSAADAYKQRVPQQKSTFEAIRNEYATAIAGALTTVRAGIVKFWSGMIIAFAALLAGIGSAILAAASVIGTPAGLITLAGAFIVAIAAIGTAFWLLDSDCTTANTELTTAQSAGLTTWPALVN